ncbi:hypothetical protein DFH06DRAFT_291001 [Mycena polygramma]|nr:hypothetical protein DFH06DRAFT_291001 [Mycena polygramma]
MSAAELRVRLAELDAEITQQSQRMKDLRDNRVSLQSQLDAVLVYPVLTLPLEITSEIFIHCLPNKITRVMLNEAPFVLLKICRQWREIALSTPKLWATLDVNVLRMRRSSSWWVSQAVYWLSLARRHTLKVALRHPPENQTASMFQSDLAFLRRIGRQVESLEVHGLEQDNEEFVHDPRLELDFSPGTFPLLKRLVYGPAVPGSGLDNLWLAFFSDAPHLHELVLLGGIDTETPFPWHQLTVFRGCNFELSQCLNILRLAPNLEECAVSIPYHGSEQEPLTHPRLRSLTLAPDSEGDFYSSVDILKLATFPALETLRLSQIAEFEADVFLAFLSRSSPSLRSLAVCPDRYSFDTWEQSFRLIPDLEELHLVCCESEFQTDFMKTFSTNEDRLLPRLQRLYLYSTWGDVRLALTERKKQVDDKLVYALIQPAPGQAFGLYNFGQPIVQADVQV